MLGQLFWSSLLIIFGLSILLGALFGINIPVFRILLGGFFIYLGIQLIIWHSRKEHLTQSIYFSKRSIIVDNAALASKKPLHYAVLFGNATLDLSKIDITPEMPAVEIEVNTIFGNTEMTLNKQISTRVVGSSSFGSTVFPDQTEITFGNYTYRSKDGETPRLIVRTSTVFGKLEIHTAE